MWSLAEGMLGTCRRCRLQRAWETTAMLSTEATDFGLTESPHRTKMVAEEKPRDSVGASFDPVGMIKAGCGGNDEELLCQTTGTRYPRIH